MSHGMAFLTAGEVGGVRGIDGVAAAGAADAVDTEGTVGAADDVSMVVDSCTAELWESEDSDLMIGDFPG
jgi:hypothetical protein